MMPWDELAEALAESAARIRAAREMWDDHKRFLINRYGLAFVNMGVNPRAWKQACVELADMLSLFHAYDYDVLIKQIVRWSGGKE